MQVFLILNLLLVVASLLLFNRSRAIRANKVLKLIFPLTTFSLVVAILFHFVPFLLGFFPMSVFAVQLLFTTSSHDPLTGERLKQIGDAVDNLLQEKKPFLRKRYCLKDLSEDTCIPLHQLSACINQVWGKNFNNFINEYRVHYCKEKILNHECRNKKLEAVAVESGFNNRNTFAIAFKKVIGVNPSEFLKSVNLNDDEGSHVFGQVE